MSILSLNAVLCLVLVGFAEGQSKAAVPQRIGDLLVELTPGTSTPSQLIPGLPTPPPGRYWKSCCLRQFCRHYQDGVWVGINLTERALAYMASKVC